jgi:hypothetical protein
MKELVIPICTILEQYLQAVVTDDHCHIVCAVVHALPAHNGCMLWQRAIAHAAKGIHNLD